MMKLMPDRVRVGWGEDAPELPSWMELPPLPEGNGDDTFGELSSSHAPMLGRR